MRLFRAAAVVLLSVLLISSCSNSKKVGSGIDVESLDEKASRLGKLDVPKKDEGAGFVGEKEREQEEQAQAQASQAPTEAETKKAEQANASVAFNITSQGYDPYYIRVFQGGIVSATNRDSTERSVSADRGEFDSGPIAPGETWTYTANKVGKFNFSDETRPFVVGTLEVLAR